MLSERLKIAMEAKSMRQIDLVRRLNEEGERVSAAAVNKWFTGRTQKIRGNLLLKTARVLNVTPEWLNSGTGPAFVEIDHNVTPALVNVQSKLIPIVSYVHAGFPDSSQQIYDEYVYVDDGVPDDAFALHVKGDSMLPEFHDGDLIIIDPTIQTYPGDYVIARLCNEDECTFKKLRYEGLDKTGKPIMVLVPLNNDYPIIDSRNNQFEIIGKVIEHRSFFKTRRG